MESGREQNYWPGFVDALSNVVLTLVFVIVIFVFALVMSANKVEKKMQELKAEQAQIKEKTTQQQSQPDASQQELIKENEDLRQQLAKAQQDIEQLHKKGAAPSGDKTEGQDPTSINDTAESKGTQIDITQNPNQKVSQGAVGIQTAENKITLRYPISVAAMDDKSSAAVLAVLEGIKNKFGKHKISINSIAGKEPYSAARRYAYYRAISLRSLLISKGIADTADISTHIAESSAPEDGRVEIIFERQ